MPDTHSSKINHLLRAILLAFLVVAASLVFWTVFRAPVILARDDNPRAVEAELRIQRGRIFDRANALLAQTTQSGAVLSRNYPLPATGPVVGYYSLRHGTAGVEESYDAFLRGETGSSWQAQTRDLLHQPQIGGDLRLTLDGDLQSQADELLGDHTGALLLLQLGATNAATNQILALSSHPGYDPNHLDEEFERLSADAQAPLLNRVTQGQYQPGLVLQPFILAAALEQGIIALDQPVDHANRPVVVNGVATYCASPPPAAATWADILTHRCPGPMLDLAGEFDATELAAAFSAFALTEQPQLPLNTETAVSAPISNTSLALIGQDTLIVTPLQIGVAWAALVADGRLPTLQLVEALQDENGGWLAELASESTEDAAVRPEIARSIHEALPGDETGQAFSVLVLSGPDGSTNSWYLGVTADSDPAYAVVVVLENNHDLAEVARIGQAMLTAVPQP